MGTSMKSRSKKPEAALAADAPVDDQIEIIDQIEGAKGDDEDRLKSLKNSQMDGENKLDNEDAHPVSGTSSPKIVEKQPFKASCYADCSTQLSHNRVRDAALSYSNDDVIVDSINSSRSPSIE